MENKDLQNLVPLSKIALTLGINKSRLHHYVRIGLIKPIKKISKVDIYDEKKILTLINRVDSLQHDGKELKEIAKILKKKKC